MVELTRDNIVIDEFETLSGMYPVSSGDVTGDGIDDALLVGPRDGVYVVSGVELAGPGNPQVLAEFWEAGTVVSVGDVNGDCQPDLMTGFGFESPTNVFFGPISSSSGDQPGDLYEQHSDPTVHYLADIRIGFEAILCDLNGDGVSDIVGAAGFSAAAIPGPRPAGTIDWPWPDSAPVFSRYLFHLGNDFVAFRPEECVGDINGDDADELAVLGERPGYIYSFPRTLSRGFDVAPLALGYTVRGRHAQPLGPGATRREIIGPRFVALDDGRLVTVDAFRVDLNGDRVNDYLAGWGGNVYLFVGPLTADTYAVESADAHVSFLPVALTPSRVVTGRFSPGQGPDIIFYGRLDDDERTQRVGVLIARTASLLRALREN